LFRPTRAWSIFSASTARFPPPCRPPVLEPHRARLLPPGPEAARSSPRGPEHRGREPQPPAPVACSMISPQVVVHDVAAAAEYYRDVSGFRFLYFLDPHVFAIVARHCVEIQFGRADRETPPSPNWTGRQGRPDARIWVNDLDSLHKGNGSRGAQRSSKRVD